jgi:hypothetical protein
MTPKCCSSRWYATASPSWLSARQPIRIAPDENGECRPECQALVTFDLEQIVDLQLEDFSTRNVLSSLTACPYVPMSPCAYVP